MLSTQAFKGPKAQIEAALNRGRKRAAVARADPPAARLASVALAMTV